MPHSIGYIQQYIWSAFPSPTTPKIDIGALFSFDIPSALLFFLYLVGSVGLMKFFTYIGTKLGLDRVSEEPVNIPTR